MTGQWVSASRAWYQHCRKWPFLGCKPEPPFTAMLISRSRGICLIRTSKKCHCIFTVLRYAWSQWERTSEMLAQCKITLMVCFFLLERTNGQREIIMPFLLSFSVSLIFLNSFTKILYISLWSIQEPWTLLTLGNIFFGHPVSMDKSQANWRWGREGAMRGRASHKVWEAKALSAIEVLEYIDSQKSVCSKQVMFYRARLKGRSEALWILFLLLLTTSAWPCQQHSQNLGPAFEPSIVPLWY